MGSGTESDTDYSGAGIERLTMKKPQKNVLDQVRAQVLNQVWGQVQNQVRDQVLVQVWDQVWGQVRAFLNKKYK